jgi:hypothetical protein
MKCVWCAKAITRGEEHLAFDGEPTYYANYHRSHTAKKTYWHAACYEAAEERAEHDLKRSIEKLKAKLGI